MAVLELPGDPRFVEESPDCRCVRSVLALEQLEDHVASEGDLAGAVHDSHATGTDLRFNDITGNFGQRRRTDAVSARRQTLEQLLRESRSLSIRAFDGFCFGWMGRRVLGIETGCGRCVLSQCGCWWNETGGRVVFVGVHVT